MPGHAKAPPTGIPETIDRYFLENRHRLLDIAAFLDRVDRADADGSAMDDFRIIAFRKAVAELLTPDCGRTERILAILSDPSPEPRESAAGLPAACGAFSGEA
jgi:hypothetical protein